MALPSVGGSEDCTGRPPAPEACAWIAAHDAVVTGVIVDIRPYFEPTTRDGVVVSDCAKSRGGLELELAVTNRLWGESPDQMVVRVGPEQLLDWSPRPMISSHHRRSHAGCPNRESWRSATRSASRLSNSRISSSGVPRVRSFSPFLTTELPSKPRIPTVPSRRPMASPGSALPDSPPRLANAPSPRVPLDVLPCPSGFNPLLKWDLTRGAEPST